MRLLFVASCMLLLTACGTLTTGIRSDLRTFREPVGDTETVTITRVRRELNVPWGAPMVYAISYRVLNKTSAPRCARIVFRSFSGQPDTRRDGQGYLLQPGQSESVAGLYSNMDGSWVADINVRDWIPGHGGSPMDCSRPPR